MQQKQLPVPFEKIVSLVKVNSLTELQHGPSWLTTHPDLRYNDTGFGVGEFNRPADIFWGWGNWICLTASDGLVIWSDDDIKAIAASFDALASVGLVETLDSPQWFQRFITAFNEGSSLIYVKPDLDSGDDGAGIVVLEREPHRQPLTGSVDAERTWVIIASEYVSSREVDGIRLSYLLGKLDEFGIAFKLGPRGPEPK